jgi:hypothetical protein
MSNKPTERLWVYKNLVKDCGFVDLLLTPVFWSE